MALVLSIVFVALIVSGATGRSFTSALKTAAFYGCLGWALGYGIHSGIKKLVWDRRKR